jgi:hypothetical protein
MKRFLLVVGSILKWLDEVGALSRLGGYLQKPSNETGSNVEVKRLPVAPEEESKC